MPKDRKLTENGTEKIPDKAAAVETVTDGTDRSDDTGERTSNPHDKGYKRVLKNRRVLLHMLRKYTDFKWAWDVREEDIEFEDKEFVTDYFHTYESDLISKIRLGEQAFIRECFRKGEKKMISGFEQIVIAERENAKQEGIGIGVDRGIERGIELNVIQLVVKKLKKSYTVVQIAEALEEPEEKVDRIVKIAQKYAPEYDERKILDEMMGTL